MKYSLLDRPWQVNYERGQAQVERDEYTELMEASVLKISSESPSCLTLTPESNRFSEKGASGYRLSVWVKGTPGVWGKVRFKYIYHEPFWTLLQDYSPWLEVGEEWDKVEVSDDLWHSVAHSVFLEIQIAGGSIWIGDWVMTYMERHNELQLPKTFLIDRSEGERVFTLPLLKEKGELKDERLLWITEDETIIQVEDDKLVPKQQGMCGITVMTRDRIVSSTCQVQVVGDQPIDEFEQILEKWAHMKEETIDPQTIDNATLYWQTMDKNKSRKGLWYEPQVTIPRIWPADKINKDLSKLKSMTLMAISENSPLKGDTALIDDIMQAMRWIYDQCYGPKHVMSYTWWQWDIGIPHLINDIFVLLKDYWEQDDIEAVMGFIHHQLMVYPEYMQSIVGGRFATTGANLIDQIKTALIPALFLKDSAKLERCKTLLLTTLNEVIKGDGFYKDGSFVQHVDIAYTGSYGAVYLKGIAELLDVFHDSAYALKEKEVEKIYEIVIKSYLPILHAGRTMDMVMGRGIVRQGNNTHKGTAHDMVVRCIQIGETAPRRYKQTILGTCKYYMQQDVLCDYTQGVNAYLKEKIIQLVKDRDISAQMLEQSHYEYCGMNRTVHHAPNYAVGISKSSNRIATYEVTNYENQKAWHTGDGMVYVYTKDLGHYDRNYWVTVDWDKLPGVTADPYRERSWGEIRKGDAKGRPSNTWVGGVTFNGKYGISGMQLCALDGKEATDLTANKSWFFFDNVIIALGSGICHSMNRNIETTIEQRQVQGAQAISINGVVQSDELGWEKQIEGVSWAHLVGGVRGSDIGYYFPNTETLKIRRKTQCGTYHDISVNNDKQYYSADYITMWMDHGMNPQNSQYAYALLPGMTEGQVKTYSGDPEFAIIHLSETIHAIRHKRLNILGISYYGKANEEIEGIRVTSETALMLGEKDGTINIALSDPILMQDEVQIILLNRKLDKIIDKDSEMLIQQREEDIWITVDTRASLGRTFEVTLKCMSVK